MPTLSLPPDAAVDLHLHTRYSDGTWLPADLFDLMARERFRLVSVVDHDQLAHLPEMLALGADRGIGVIQGTEVTTEWRGLPAHLLCYAPLPGGFTGDALRGVVDGVVARMLANTRMIYDAMLARGYTFPRQREALAAQGGEPIRAMDVARLLLAHGYASEPDEALRMVVEAGYEQARAPLAAVIAAAHASGALCVLAHPGRGDGEIHGYTPEEIAALAEDVPLDGIEVYYPTHTPVQVAAYAALARRLGLLEGAGSDSHGPRGRAPVSYSAAQVAPLLARLGVEVR
ncbi:MAG TPA: PHP domain-containing protein [Ktedonobacterales bacterium]